MEKYLPIGTVCSLDSTNRKYLIAGYFSLEYNSNVKMYDYIGLPYPEGLLLHNKIISFNHEDIVKVEFLGYNDEMYNLFNNNLLEQTDEVDTLEQDNDFFYNFKFDENGVVVYEYQTTYKEEKNNLNDFNFVDEVENPFNKKYDFLEQKNDTENDEKTWSVFKEYKFDENGVVVSSEDKQEEVANENTETEEEYSKQYEFDENGIVVSIEE